MAKAFPKSRFSGFDYHHKSIEAARESAKREDLADRVTFDVAKAKEYPGKDYDFVAVFDVCTIWAIRSGLPRTSGSLSVEMARG
jgi:tRNA/tmRNA/rRNA uracil-C5-methylase (TrmA/RlmC/RlmD family)